MEPLSLLPKKPRFSVSYEEDFWGGCTDTFCEEVKQYVYARLMGLKFNHYAFDLTNTSVLDIGAGPVSLLLKCYNLKRAKIVDPIEFPSWVYGRYSQVGIEWQVCRGEDINETGWDEVWIYNCLQHVDDPRKVIANMRRAGKLIRLFEWVNMPSWDGHPHTLTRDFLDDCLQCKGTVVNLNESECVGNAYVAITPT